MSLSYFKTATCDICRKIFREIRKRYYCEHCKEYFYVCDECKQDDFKLKCPNCGVRLKQKSAPLAINR
ncbi:MAG: hypothetical protein JXB50_09535 [Spirochaetes bacterium]|nr:hypothetical protein [Spirochaetota bacterium]